MDNVIDLTEDDSIGADPSGFNDVSDQEDEDLKLAIALSLQDQKADSTPTVAATLLPTPQRPEPPAKAQSSLLGLNRKAMEAERLARLKRKRNNAEDAPEFEIEQSSIKKSKPSPSPSQKQIIDPPTPTISSSFTQPQSGPRPQPQADSSFHFPKGNVLLTAIPSRLSPAGLLEAISFFDILKPPPSPPSPPSGSSSPYILKSALLSSFIADFDWLFPHFNISGPASVKFVLVLHAHDTRHRQLLRSDFEGVKSVRLVMPEISAGGFGTMHSKLMLLFFSAKKAASKSTITAGQEICRIVVPSANLVPYDWGVGGVMENVLYVIDLPLKQAQQRDRDDSDVAEVQETQFETQLKKQLDAMSVPADVLRKLSGFDFTATMDAGFVHTISGSTLLHPSNASFSDDSAPPTPTSTGLLSLSETVASLGLSIPPTSPAYPPKLDFITSSLGNVSLTFLRQLYHAVCGRLDPDTATSTSTTVAKRGGATTKQLSSNEDQQKLDNVIRDTLNIYFPSAKTVRASKGGEAAAGTICFQKKWWDDNELIRECMRDCVGGRGDGILMHSKILYVSFKQPLPVKVANESGTTKKTTTKLCSGWAYIGSANFSESAWGRITTDAKSKIPKMTARNWETGVILPIFTDASSRLGSFDDEPVRYARHQPRASGVTSSVSVPLTPTSISDKTKTQENKTSNALLDEPTTPEQVDDKDKTSDDAYMVNGEIVSSSTGMCVLKDKIKFAPKGRRMLQVEDGSGEISSTLGETFHGAVPIPIQMPAPKLVASGLQPWFFKE